MSFLYTYCMDEPLSMNFVVDCWWLFFFEDQCSTSALFVMMSDLFDTVTLDRCDDIFCFVEDRVGTWKMVRAAHRTVQILFSVQS